MTTPRKGQTGMPMPDWDGQPTPQKINSTFKRMPTFEATEGQRVAALRGLARRGALDLAGMLGLDNLEVAS